MATNLYKNLILRKLTSPYIGNLKDITRFSVLSHTDVDNNFIFLKGEDIITGSTSGTTLILTQVNTDTIEIDLLPLLNCPDNFTTGSTLVGSSLYFDTKDALSAYTVDLSSLLDNTDNFTTGTTLVGHSLYFDRTNALSAYTVDLSSISGDTNTDNFTTGTTVIGGTAFFDRTDALSAYTLDLSPFTANTDTNDYTTGSTVVGGTAYFDRTDVLSAFTLDLTSFTANTDTNDYTTGTTLIGNVIHYNRTDTLSAFTTDLSGIIPITDYGNIIFVSEVGPTGQTRGDVVGDINKPVDLEWASQIAQSGDTIHVKAGTYNVTTTGATGLSVEGVNHYFEEEAEVYKSTTGVMFTNSGWPSEPTFTSGGNVYGAGSFYGSGSCLYVYYCGDKSTSWSGWTGSYLSPVIFEFDICENTFGYGFGGSVGGTNADVIINGKTRIITSGTSPTIFMNNGSGYKMIINCPYIESSNAVASAVYYGQAAGGCGDLIINSDMIINSGGSPTGTTAIFIGGATGRLKVKANYVSSIQGGLGVEVLRNVDLDINKIDYLYIGGDIIKMNGVVDSLNITTSSDVDVKLCHKLNIGSVNLNSNMNIGISNILSTYGGDTNTINSAGIVNLKTIDMTSISGREYPDIYVGYTATSKTYNIDSTYADPYENKVILNNKWDNGDTFNLDGGKLIIDNNASLFDNTINNNSGRLEVKGRTYDTQINYTGGTIVLNSATMIVSDQNKAIINAPNSGSTIKVYTGGLNTNKIGPFTGATQMLKVTVGGISAALTVNGETFTSTTGATAAASAAELVSLINASGTVNATGSQDTPGTDTYIYVTSDIVGTVLTMAYGFNTILDSEIRANNNPITDTVGGTIIEDTDID